MQVEIKNFVRKFARLEKHQENEVKTLPSLVPTQLSRLLREERGEVKPLIPVGLLGFFITSMGAIAVSQGFASCPEVSQVTRNLLIIEGATASALGLTVAGIGFLPNSTVSRWILNNILYLRH